MSIFGDIAHSGLSILASHGRTVTLGGTGTTPLSVTAVSVSPTTGYPADGQSEQAACETARLRLRTSDIGNPDLWETATINGEEWAITQPPLECGEALTIYEITRTEIKHVGKPYSKSGR